LKKGHNFYLWAKFKIPLFGFICGYKHNLFLRIGKNLLANVDLAQDPSFSSFYPISTPG
jgi:hypothetical protein